MLNGVTGRRPMFRAVSRGGMLSVGLLLGMGLSACTTTEGTNAFSDIGTFEREVAIETMKGMGMIEREQKPETPNRRGPLVLPKAGAPLPAPQQPSTAEAALPVDSSKVQIDTAGLTDDDIKRLRNAKVVDLHTIAGRPLTDEEAKKLTARMKAAKVSTGPRPLYLPPEKYFTTVQGQDLVCLAASGELVPLNDPGCPPEIRKALASAKKS